MREYIAVSLRVKEKERMNRGAIGGWVKALIYMELIASSNR